MSLETSELKLSNVLSYVEGAYAPNTLRAYRTDMLEFITYCESTDGRALPAEASTVARFLVQTLGQGIKTSTIKRKVASISAIHRLSGCADPTKTTEVRLAVRKIERQLGSRFRQAYPVTRSVLDKLLSFCGNDLRGKRNRALLHLAYDSMRRRSELVSLRVEDIEWISEEGASILLRKSKTDQAGTGQWIHLSNEVTAVIQQWLEAAGITEGFLLRGVDANGCLAESLCDSRIGRIYKTLARLAGLDGTVVRGISGHSMRVGGAQDLLALGASLPQIMVKGGWAKTDTVMRYIERVHRPVAIRSGLLVQAGAPDAQTPGFGVSKASQSITGRPT
jgi:site-specific recombinase XerD